MLTIILGGFLLKYYSSGRPKYYLLQLRCVWIKNFKTSLSVVFLFELIVSLSFDLLAFKKATCSIQIINNWPRHEYCFRQTTKILWSAVLTYSFAAKYLKDSDKRNAFLFCLRARSVNSLTGIWSTYFSNAKTFETVCYNWKFISKHQ